MTRIAAALAAATALASGPAPAPADPAGDWVGTLRTSKIEILAGLEIRRTADGYTGVYDALSQKIWGVPLIRARPDTPMTLQATNLAGTLSFTWDPAAGRWTGAWREKGEVDTMTLRRGAIPPGPVVSRRDMIFLPVLAGIMLVEAAGIARLLQLRRRRRKRLLEAGRAQTA